ncbi:MAG: methylated-DNA--[protein]-cysteine S-methyltransferase [Candidatus Eisenbacteria bacterium]
MTTRESVALREGRFESPFGPIRFATREGILCALGFAGQWPSLRRGLVKRFGAVRWERGPSVETERMLRRYFGGDLGALRDHPVDPGGTPFQRNVWSALRRIPPGEIVSYGELARRIRRPRAARAVGAANGANPVSLVVPCHRVVRSDGDLGGYGGGGERKRKLLEHEGAVIG